ncbi:molybdate ABC transporter permease subunit [Parachitinimonas caeni]|uniref:Molybdenum transport system permease n=1 Tax=Parachitinimonas caeni TaxID=3031301 RepID=A0ABT7DXH5_9NEIS|nr:molybdate ABC transporter permease subunit [Parachitinimonas caeni]MDK2124524.1 molybdate ABC transporter permease subunit [Parachitinimonas caeni]
MTSWALPSHSDWVAIVLTAQLATLTTVILLLIAMPLAWWLARTHSLAGKLVAAVVALPLVLPPTVLGFYLLIALGEQGPIGQLTNALGLGILPFSFSGLLVASVIYTLPFAVQPLQQTFASQGDGWLEAAATLGASRLDAFFSVVLPMARPGLITAAVMSFAHTVGEFGVVLMIGGNIPGKTKVVSVQLYDHVESLEFAQAHSLAAILVAFSLLALFLVQIVNRNK